MWKLVRKTRKMRRNFMIPWCCLAGPAFSVCTCSERFAMYRLHMVLQFEDTGSILTRKSSIFSVYQCHHESNLWIFLNTGNLFPTLKCSNRIEVEFFPISPHLGLCLLNILSVNMNFVIFIRIPFYRQLKYLQWDPAPRLAMLLCLTGFLDTNS